MRRRQRNLVLGIFLTIIGAMASKGDGALAQIVPDSTLGAESSQVTPNVDINRTTSDRIDGGAIRGANLFHSFQEFSIKPEQGTQAAYFSNPARIENIFSRVTGGKPSEILGKLGVLGNANLFFINPNGIVFGKNASLDVKGSFVATTASSLKFGDGREFSATAPQSKPLLTVSVPIGLQFGSNTGSIRVEGDGQGIREYYSSFPTINPTVGLHLQENQTLGLVGGDITLDGATLKTPGGRIELASVAGSGFVSLTPIDKGFAFDYSGVSNFGNIRLSNRAAVDASSEGGGDIQVQGSQVTLNDFSRIEASTLGSGLGGNLTVNASDSIKLNEGVADPQYPADSKYAIGLFAQAYELATGEAGTVKINTPVLIVARGAEVSASSTEGSSAKGGDVIIDASKEVQVIGSSADQINPSSLIAITTENTSRQAGSVTINTPVLRVYDGGRVSATTRGSGKGGNVIVNASEEVDLNGTSADGRLPSGVFTQTRNTGEAGSLTINTPVLRVSNGAEVSASSSSTRMEGSANQGDAGNLSITARSVQLDNGKIIARTLAGNDGGNLTLNVADLLLLRRGSQISTTAGNVQQGGNGGNITINIPNGSIIAVPGENSDITANAFRGRGGNIQITASGIFGIQRQERTTDQSNDITASSQLGINGQVTINTPEVDPSQGLVALLTNLFVDPSSQIEQSCSAFDGSQGNQFIVTGRGGLPPNPFDPLSNDVVWSDTRVRATAAAHQHDSKTTAAQPTSDFDAVPITPAKGWVFNNKGEVTLIDHAPTFTRLSQEPQVVCRTANFTPR